MAGGYLQTSVIAVGSLFGPPAIQSMMAGQAAIAVVVSGVQVISSAASVVSKPRTYISDGSAEEQSAFIFLSLSTAFLIVSAGVHTWFIRMPVYKLVVASLESKPKNQDDPVQEEELRGLIPSGSTTLQSDKANVIRVAKTNIVYEVAVACVFLVTLVLSYQRVYMCCLQPLFRRYFPRSRSPLNRQTQIPTRCFLHQSIF